VAAPGEGGGAAVPRAVGRALRSGVDQRFRELDGFAGIEYSDRLRLLEGDKE
jgi:hypothetical protein